jgi:ABC-type glycerol-3-phosphate transport system substrate-binding protein
MKLHVKATTFAVLALATIFSIFLAGCGGSSAGNSSSSSSPVTITYWFWKPGKVVVKQEVSAFEKQYPNMHVNYKSPTYTDYLVNLKAVANAGSLPTVFGLQVGSMQAEYMQYLVRGRGL